MRAENQVLVAVGLVMAGVAIGVNIAGELTFVLPSRNSLSLSGIASAFVGAGAAFSLQNFRNARERKDKKIEAVNRAVFSLSRQYTRLRNVHDQIIAPNKSHPVDFVQIPASNKLPIDDISVDFDSLSFILETPERRIMETISIAYARYWSAIDAINTRPHVLITEFQPLMETAGISGDFPYDEDEMKQILGPRLFVTLQQL